VARLEEGAAHSPYCKLHFDRPVDEAWLEMHGHVPLPPYIKRPDRGSDSERYQTVYADEAGSAAAPTAGLHLTRAMLETLKDAGVEIVEVTLHVGLGTFLPVRVENLEEHRMHSEEYSISREVATRINRAKQQGQAVLAVGTTSMRTLESAWDGASVRKGRRSTDIFIYPGYKFKVVDALFTNFHTPESTLLMLVSALAGKELIMDAYREAVQQRYRFFSYGDAMLIT
jgi:S-adenosylmethionine:tRNA ribosyltransferase-isomerase